MNSGWQRLGFFYVLTFLLLAVVPIASLFLPGGMDFTAAAARASQREGVPWNSNLWNVFRLSLVEPSLWLLVWGSSVPTIAALIVVLRGRVPRWGAILDRLLPAGRARTRNGHRAVLAQYLLVFLVTVPALLLTGLVRQTLSGAYDFPLHVFSVAWVPALLTSAFLDQGAVLEEFGWRTYATHELQGGLLKPLTAAILVGVGWGLWHVPRDITTGVVGRLGLLPYLFAFLPSFLLGTIAVSILCSYFMNRLGGSLWPAVMIHGLTNDSVGLSGFTTIVSALTPYHQATKAIPMALIAVGLIWWTGGKLGIQSGSEQA